MALSTSSLAMPQPSSSSRIAISSPLPGQKNTITAQSRAVTDSTTGFSFQDCIVDADADFRGAPAGTVETYLGRPWQPIKNSQPFSRVVFIQCKMSDVINPKGWLQWDGRTDVKDIYYGVVPTRVNWPSFHVIQDSSEADKFTVKNFIQGDKWIPGDVPYTPGLSN
uniref:Pectinesterase catalytic domain-containing protein n=1 Tax=Leersia perrieri TaxID=77586 RepID=A0A0D9XG94_9ORYZ